MLLRQRVAEGLWALCRRLGVWQWAVSLLLGLEVWQLAGQEVLWGLLGAGHGQARLAWVRGLGVWRQLILLGLRLQAWL